MRIIVADTPRAMGEEAARLAEEILCRAIRERGRARLAVSTGASQMDALAALTRRAIPWQQVELFQIAERLGQETIGSGRRALRDRLARKLPLMRVHYLDASGENMNRLGKELRKQPMDLLLIGIGDQGQIGFNAAPADFEADEAYIRIPAGEGDGVVTMSIREMMRSRHVIACAPYAIHAENVRRLIRYPLTPDIPATALKRHAELDLLLDRESAGKISVQMAADHNPSLTVYRIMYETEQEE